MKKIFMMLLILFIIYIGIQLGFRFFGSGHEYEYQIVNGDNVFNIKEKFVNNAKNEKDSYYFEIGINELIFSYQTYNSFNNLNHIIEDIIYYNDNQYNCILPIFIDGKIISDIMCMKGNILYNYRDIKGKNSNLDKFVGTLTQYNYDITKWQDSAASSNIEGITIYKDNMENNHSLAFTTYKGVFVVNDATAYKPKMVDLFINDVYKRPVSVFFKNYYIVADYNAQYRFDKFYVVDLVSNEVNELDCGREISFDSYIQGTKNNSIYLFDRDSKKQYEINVKTNKVLEVGNENNGIKIFRNNAWDKITAISAKNNNIIFDGEYQSDIENNDFVQIHKVGGDETGYYYFYQKSGSEYNVYRATSSNTEQLTYLFKTTDINRVRYYQNGIYYIYNNEIRRFDDNLGIRTLIRDKELSFNNNLSFGLYVK